MPRLAFYTFGITKESYGHPLMQGFVQAFPDVFREAEEAPGYISRAIRPDPQDSFFGQNYGAFGDFAVPRFYTMGTALTDMRIAVTLSVWTGIAAVHRFAYGGAHKQALAQRMLWIAKPDYPPFVMWWVDDDQTPTWQDAADRLEYLHDHGPSPRAFKFSSAHDAEGNRLMERTMP
jgi:hypothetical protein